MEAWLLQPQSEGLVEPVAIASKNHQDPPMAKVKGHHLHAYKVMHRQICHKQSVHYFAML